MRTSSDESYVIDLCDKVLGCVAIRGHRFPFLCGDKGHLLPVDAFYEDLKLVVEYRERQHTESVPHFDRKVTVSGMPRGKQRSLYDQRRRDVLPAHGITLIEFDCGEFSFDRRKRLKREPEDLGVVRAKLAPFMSRHKKEPESHPAAHPRTTSIVVGCLDVGRDAGWAFCIDQGLVHGTIPTDFARVVAQALNQGRRVAIGFEFPTYVPRSSSANIALRARSGEGSRSWSAAAGLGSLAAGLVQGTGVLSEIANSTAGISATTRWREFESGRAALLVWEAFISSAAGEPITLPAEWLKRTTAHEWDALAAVRAFQMRIVAGNPSSDLGSESALSLIGLQLLAAGLSNDVSLLTELSVVVRARKPIAPT